MVSMIGGYNMKLKGSDRRVPIYQYKETVGESNSVIKPETANAHRGVRIASNPLSPMIRATRKSTKYAVLNWLKTFLTLLKMKTLITNGEMDDSLPYNYQS